MLLEALRVVRNAPGLGRTKLLLAPRHPERFDPVAALATACGYAVRRRSTGGAPAGGADVYVLDTLGELSSVYAFATVVFVGGTLTGHGGHSVMEPALHAKPIVVGPSMENFRAVADEFRCAGGMRQLSGSGPDELRQVLIQLLQDPPEREALGRTAFSILEQNRGAARRTMDRVFPVLEAAAGMMKRP